MKPAGTVTDLSGVTPAWISGVLDDVTVTGVSAERIGTGQMSGLSRLTLSHAGDRGEAPATVLAKFAAEDPETREFAKAAGLYGREAHFYDELAWELPTRTPLAYYTGLGADEGTFLILFEDLEPARTVDQIEGCTPDNAALAVEQAAGLHGSSWEKADFLSREWLRGGAGMWQMAGEQIAAMEGAFRDRFEDQIEPEYLALAERLVSDVGGWLALLERPRCLWHGDFRLDNMLFDAKGGGLPVAIVDWQTVTLGLPALDVAYFLGSGMAEADRRAHEEELVRGYHTGLISQGVGGYTWDECWCDYRAHAICGFLGALIGAARAERSERGDRMLLSMARRHGRQVLDLDSFSALERR